MQCNAECSQTALTLAKRAAGTEAAGGSQSKNTSDGLSAKEKRYVARKASVELRVYWEEEKGRLTPGPRPRKRSSGGGADDINGGSHPAPEPADVPPAKRRSTAGGSLPSPAKDAAVKPASVMVPTVPVPATQHPLPITPPVVISHCATPPTAVALPALAQMASCQTPLLMTPAALFIAAAPAQPGVPLIHTSAGGGATAPVTPGSYSPDCNASPDAPHSGHASNGFGTPAQQQQQQQQCQGAGLFCGGAQLTSPQCAHVSSMPVTAGLRAAGSPAEPPLMSSPGLMVTGMGGFTTAVNLWHHFLMPFPRSRESAVNSTTPGGSTAGTPDSSPALPPAAWRTPSYEASGSCSPGSGGSGSFTGSEYSADEEVAAEVLVQLRGACFFDESAQVQGEIVAAVPRRTSARQQAKLRSSAGGQGRRATDKRQQGSKGGRRGTTGLLQQAGTGGEHPSILAKEQRQQQQQPVASLFDMAAQLGGGAVVTITATGGGAAAGGGGAKCAAGMPADKMCAPSPAPTVKRPVMPGSSALLLPPLTLSTMGAAGSGGLLQSVAPSFMPSAPVTSGAPAVLVGQGQLQHQQQQQHQVDLSGLPPVPVSPSLYRAFLLSSAASASAAAKQAMLSQGATACESYTGVLDEHLMSVLSLPHSAQPALLQDLALKSSLSVPPGVRPALHAYINTWLAMFHAAMPAVAPALPAY
jgi:hypothetical protein